MRWFRRTKPAPAAGAGAIAIHLGADNLSADLLPEEQWLELAERSLREENFRFALRAFYLAALAWLGRRELIAIHPGKTNREYELELRRRAREFPETRDLFAASIVSFERAWYGMHEVSRDEVGQFARRIGRMKEGVAA
jgi:hypothetical protein